MCDKCFEEDEIHVNSHKVSILPFDDYLKYIASEISRVNSTDSAFITKDI